MDSVPRLFDFVLSILGVLGGWWMKVMWETLKDLQTADRQLAEKLSSIEVLVAGNYVKREEFDKIADAIFKKLDRIDDKLSNKADR
jgi:hypothetical protein